MAYPHAKLGRFLRKERETRGWDREYVAQQLHVTYGTIANYELGRTSPGIEGMKAYAKLFNISIDILLRIDAEEGDTTETIAEHRGDYIIAGQPHLFDEVIRVRIPVTLELRIRREAEEKELSFNDYLVSLLEKAMMN